jgi:glycerol-3-phosphate dehydrogenase (NAD+)
MLVSLVVCTLLLLSNGPARYSVASLTHATAMLCSHASTHLFCRHLQQDTILLSCGVADLIATCYLGRNSRCGAAFAKNLLHELESSSSSSDSDHNEGIAVKPLWAKAVQKVCSGQHPPGISTSSQVFKCLLHRYGDSKERVFERYPLFTRIYEVAREGKTPERMFKWKQL